jgi:hypothetical protein
METQPRRQLRFNLTGRSTGSMGKEFDPGKAATWRSGTSKTPLDDSYQKAAAGVVEHQHRITCVSIHPAYFEVEQLGSSTVDRDRFLLDKPKT